MLSGKVQISYMLKVVGFPSYIAYGHTAGRTAENRNSKHRGRCHTKYKSD
jgi:hypothetical protein